MLFCHLGGMPFTLYVNDQGSLQSPYFLHEASSSELEDTETATPSQCSSILRLFCSQVNPSHQFSTLNIVFHSTSYHFPTLILRTHFTELRASLPLCLLSVVPSTKNSFYVVLSKQTSHPFSSVLKPFPS